MAKFSYIDRRIISNTGSMVTRIPDAPDFDARISYLNSFSDISQYGLSNITDTKAITPQHFYNINSLLETNELPPFEMCLEYTEYFGDHVNPDFTGREKTIRVPFSPLNTVFFAKSMVFANDLKADINNGTLNTISKYGYDSKEYGRNEYHNEYLLRYPNIAPAILFSASLPIDTQKLGNLIYDDLKTPGLKQIPYSFALWLGSKWHYFKHKGQIYLGQDDWILDEGVLDKRNNKNSLKNLYRDSSLAQRVPRNMTDLSNYMGSVFIYKDSIVAISDDNVYSVTNSFDIVRGKHRFTLSSNSTVNGFQYPSTFLDSAELPHNGYVLSFTLPTIISENGELSNMVENGIGVNYGLLSATHSLLEGRSLDELGYFGETVGCGVLGNLKHYETNRKPINLNENKPIFADSGVDFGKKSVLKWGTNLNININELGCYDKLDIISKSYYGTYPGVFPLKYYPKFTNTRTVDINAIYSITTYFSQDKTEIEYLGREVYNLQNIIKNSTGQSTIDFYNSLKGYILYNKKINGSYLNELISEAINDIGAIGNMEAPTKLVLNQLKNKKLTISNDDLLELMWIILSASGIKQTKIEEGLKSIFGNSIASELNLLYQRYPLTSNKYFSEVQQRIIATENNTVVSKVSSTSKNIFVEENNFYLSYPRLFMSLFHGYLELTAKNKISPLTENMFGVNKSHSIFDLPDKVRGTLFTGNVDGKIDQRIVENISKDGNVNINFHIIKLFVCRLIDKIIIEQINNAVSIDREMITDTSTKNGFVAKLYPSAGGTVNLGYGLNTHFYTDIVLPINGYNGVDSQIRSKRLMTIKQPLTTGNVDSQTVVHRIHTVIDPRVMHSYYINKDYQINSRIENPLADRFINKQYIFTDDLLRDNLQNIQNSGIRYLWYSGPYFGAPIAQLSIDKIVFAHNLTINNTNDISTVPRTNYKYSELNSKFILDYELTDRGHINLSDVKLNQLSSVAQYDGFAMGPNQYGPYPNNQNIGEYLPFSTVIKQLGHDMLDQLEQVFLDFCKLGISSSSILNFDDTMRLLLRVDSNDLSDTISYVSNTAMEQISESGNDTIVSGGIVQLNKEEQANFLITNHHEADVDLLQIISDKSNERKYTLAYVKNIILTKSQYNKAKKVLSYLNSSENDIYVKRNWVQNSIDNNLVKFYTNRDNINLFNTRLLANATVENIINRNSVTTLYSRYLESLFDHNYSSSKLVLTELKTEDFKNLNIPEIWRGVYDNTYDMLSNKSLRFLSLLIGAVSSNGNNKMFLDNRGIRLSHTQLSAGELFYNYINKIADSEQVPYFSDKNVLYGGYLSAKKSKNEFRKYLLSSTWLKEDPLFNLLLEFESDSGYDQEELLFALFSEPVVCNRSNKKLITALNTLYLSILNKALSDCINIRKSETNDSFYLWTLVDEIEQLILKTVENYGNGIINGCFITMNNFLYNSYQNTQNYFNSHISALVNVLRESTVTSNSTSEGSVTNSSGVVSDAIRIKPYYNIKKLHDTWLYNYIGTNVSDLNFYHLTYYTQPCYLHNGRIETTNNDLFGKYFHFVDRGNGDISSELLFDIDWFGKYFVENIENKKVSLNTTTLESSLYTFLGDVANSHHCLFHALPSFNGLGLDGISGPNTLSTEMFKTYNYLQFKEAAGPHFVFQYIGDVTSSLASTNSQINNKTDLRQSFDLSSNNTPKDIKNSGHHVTGFDVQFGEQNQQIFSNFNVDQSEFSNTEEYFDVITNLTKNGNVKTVGNDLYRIYDSRSYNATITAMGNMEIEPLMYFNLKNVPLFRGAYWITNISHDITPNHMVTTFKGVRQPIATVRPGGELFLQLKKDNIQKAITQYNASTSLPESSDITTESGLYRSARLRNGAESPSNFSDSIYKNSSLIKNYTAIINTYLDSDLNDRILSSNNIWDRATTNNTLLQLIMRSLGKDNLTNISFESLPENKKVNFAFLKSANGWSAIKNMLGVSINGREIPSGDWFKIPVGTFVYIYSDGNKLSTYGMIIRDQYGESALLHVVSDKVRAYYLYDTIAVYYKNGVNTNIKVTMLGIDEIYADSLIVGKKVGSRTVSWDGYAAPFIGKAPKNLGAFISNRGGIVINRYHQPSSCYNDIPSGFKYIALHHTNGSNNPYATVDYWCSTNIKNKTKVGMEFVIGGRSFKQNAVDANKFNGVVVQAFPSCHTANGNSAVNSSTIGIELCSFGPLLLDGDKYYATKSSGGKLIINKSIQVDLSEVVKLVKPFRGYEYYHKYSDEQIAQLKKILLYLKERNNIDITGDGIVRKLKDMFAKDQQKIYEYAIKLFDENMLNSNGGLTINSGVFSHTNVIKSGKWDIAPQPKLINMLLSL